MSREVGYHGEYYWSGRFWYIASKETDSRGRPIAIGCGATKEAALAEMNDILNYINKHSKNP